MCKLLPVKGHLLSRLCGEALKLVPLLHHPQSDSLALWGDGPAPLRHATHTQLQRAAAALLSCHDTIIASLGQPATATAAAPNGGEAKGGGRGSTPAYQVREAPNMWAYPALLLRTTTSHRYFAPRTRRLRSR